MDDGFERGTDSGAGADLGLGLQWRKGRVAFGARVRAMVADESEEWGANMLLSASAGADGQGLSLTLSPSYGVADSGVRRLWGQGVSRLTTGRGSTLPVPGSFHTVRTNLEIAYGARNHAGLFTPFGELAAQGPNRAYKAGVRMELDSGWRLSLEGERRMGVFASDSALMLTFQWGDGAATVPLPHRGEPPAGQDRHPDRQP